MKVSKYLKNTRILLLLIFLVLALFSIYPNPWNDGATIRTVEENSSANLAGVSSSSPNARPMSRERILMMNNIEINNAQEYHNFITNLKPNRTVYIKTNRRDYSLITQPLVNITTLNELEEKIISITNSSNHTINKTIMVNKTLTEVIGTKELGLTVYDSPKTNLKKGLELQGGTRVLLEPENKLSPEDTEFLIDNMKRRLNVFGLTDIVIKQVNELPEPFGSGKQFILVEIAGANEEEVKELLGKQGKFEAKIINNTVFSGGKDIVYVCRSAECAGIDPNSGCGRNGDHWLCRFRFSITLSQEAAENQAEETNKLTVEGTSGNSYLSEPLSLYLDNSKVDELQIGADLKGRAVTEISISGAGQGVTEQEAVLNSLNNMKKLQTILITGSLPVKLTIVKTDNISPALGKEFLQNSLKIGIYSILAVALIILLRYRKFKIIAPLVITLLSEIILLMGFASLVGWNIDIAAVAGIIIVVGTGVDHLIVITDETLKGEQSQFTNWKDLLKKAIFIITAAYVTTIVAMIPLWYAGAGMLKGFAITTIVGVTFGVFIARPAYAAMIELILKD